MAKPGPSETLAVQAINSTVKALRRAAEAPTGPESNPANIEAFANSLHALLHAYFAARGPLPADEED